MALERATCSASTRRTGRQSTATGHGRRRPARRA